jgi:hypothetical protein
MLPAALAAFVLGLYLTRFNVFSVVMATAFATVIAFIVAVASGSTLLHSLQAGLVIALALQVGYILGQMIRWPRK